LFGSQTFGHIDRAYSRKYVGELSAKVSGKLTYPRRGSQRRLRGAV